MSTDNILMSTERAVGWKERNVIQFMGLVRIVLVIQIIFYSISPKCSAATADLIHEYQFANHIFTK